MGGVICGKVGGVVLSVTVDAAVAEELPATGCRESAVGCRAAAAESRGSLGIGIGRTGSKGSGGVVVVGGLAGA